MKLIADLPAQTEMRVVTNFLRSIGLSVRYKDGQLIAEGRSSSAADSTDQSGDTK